MSARYRLGSGVGLVTCALGLALASVTATAIAADSIYWSNSGGKIRVGNLNGSGTPTDLFSTSEHSPYGVAINPQRARSTGPTPLPAARSASATSTAAGRRWTCSRPPPRTSPSDGGGTPTDLSSTSESGPEGVAIDPAAGKIYWANDVSGKIRVGNLNGSGTPADLFPTTEDSPTGVAIDPTAGKIYWTNYTSGIIRVGNLNGSGTPMDLFPAESSSPVFTALLRAPLTLASPTVAGGARVGSLLSCSRGAWAGDLLGAFLYRAPQRFAYRWIRNGADISGATGSSYHAAMGGKYSCRVSAANAAGVSSRTSQVHPIKPRKPTIKRAEINHKKSSARFSFGSGGASGFQCALVKPKKKGKKRGKPKFSACKSPKTYKHLQSGKYTFEVRGQSAAGPGPTAKRAFAI
ncbi:MAG: hypothetical protein E6G00_02280 [Actinobacteria bacterium]|nr:MAG: hypothetical protein E6G00_02280 [Actinomycetota bacterium]